MSTNVHSLTHAMRRLPGGAMTLVLNTGAAIGPEAEAMLQALHSRSIGGIASHLEVLKNRGPEKFMSTYYVGYGHKSIGDCGSCTIFIEGVSMLAAKAIQDTPLYSGQEASTRYIDFAAQPFIDPIGSETSRKIQEAWRSFYLRGIETLIPELKERHPRGEDEKEAVYEKAVAARAFDIMRAFLPAGASTNLAWHTNLRQAADHLLRLRNHPLEEVRAVAVATEEALLEAFPNSFSTKRYEATEDYTASVMHDAYYFNGQGIEMALSHNGIDIELLQHHRYALTERPPKAELPKFLSEGGTARFDFLLDFGSFRDLQRHRATAQRMPLLTTEHGFAQWYLDQLPKSLREDAQLVLKQQQQRIAELGAAPEVSQYYLPMGYQVTCRLTGDLPALTYLVELRSGQAVHPTLRVVAQRIAQLLEDAFGEHGLVVHADYSATRFDTKRGEHDIVRVK